MVTKYDALFQIIESEMAKRAAKGLPLGLHLWDGNHAELDPREIFSHPEIIRIASKYGKPVLLPEDVDAESMNNLVAGHKSGDPKVIKANRAFFQASGERYHPNDPKRSAQYADALGRIFEHAANGVEVFYSDTRGKSEFNFQFNKKDERHFKQIFAAISGLSNPLLCMDIVEKKLAASLSPKDSKSFAEFVDKFIKMATSGAQDTAEIDKKIAENVIKKFPNIGKPESYVPIMLYGAVHYHKEADLDELLPGLSIAIYNAPGAMRGLEGKNPDLYNDFPDYIYYSESGRVVKMDTPEAKAEALGYTVEQFKAWEMAALDRKPSPDYKAPELPLHIQKMCDEATAHIKPYKQGSKSGAAQPNSRPNGSGVRTR